MFLQETFVVQDCVKYDTTEHTKTYSSTKVETIESTTGLADCVISIDLKSTTDSYSCVWGIANNTESDQVGVGGLSSASMRLYRTLNGVNTHQDFGSSNHNNTYWNLRFERVNTTLKVYFNDSVIATITDNEISSLAYLTFISWKNKTLKYKNLKVKAL